MLNRSLTVPMLTIAAFLAMASMSFDQNELFGGNLVSLLFPEEMAALDAMAEPVTDFGYESGRS